jgi:D-amino-acid oxidase
VRVIARHEATVSEVAGGLWLPYGVDARAAGWALATLEWLDAPDIEYRHLESARPWWIDALPPARVLADGEGEWRVRVPLVAMAAHLQRLWDEPVERRAVGSLEELDGLVVNCSGLGARQLAGDDTLVAVRGQVVYLRAAPGTPCICDQDTLTYVLPRADVCVVGGSAQPGDEDTAVREPESREILARAFALVPSLRDAEVLGARAGLRPTRAGGPRLERVGDVIHCYGHGGAGVTLSWGCAQEVVELALGAQP